MAPKKIQYDEAYEKPEFDKNETGKDKKFVLSICDMSIKEMKSMSKKLLGNMNNYIYHYSSNGKTCG